VGAASGGIWGKVRDKGFRDEDLKAIGESLTPPNVGDLCGRGRPRDRAAAAGGEVTKDRQARRQRPGGDADHGRGRRDLIHHHAAPAGSNTLATRRVLDARKGLHPRRVRSQDIPCPIMGR
jgi:hypothetical protein